MILLDSCCLLEILWGGGDAVPLARFLDREQGKDVPVAILNLVALETSCVISVHHRGRRAKGRGSIDDDLDAVSAFDAVRIADDMTPSLVRRAARIKYEHAASMVDCLLIAYALEVGGQVLSADPDISRYNPQKLVVNAVGQRFKAIRWR